MLSKLLKYETRATARFFLPLFALALLMATVNRVLALLTPDRWQAPGIISMTLYVIILVGIFVMTIVVMIQRFYKNLLSDEGYLMFTLPVPTWAHITSKLLVAMFWTFASTLVGIGTILIIASEALLHPTALQEIGNFIRMVSNEVPNAWLFTIEVILLLLVSSAANVLMIYAAITIGHLVSEHRILASIGAYFGLNTAMQILFTLLGLIPAFPFRNIPSHLAGMDTQLAFAHGMLWFIIALSLLTCAICWAITHWVIKRKLNLE